MNEMKA